ncbi:MAG: dihydroorotase [Steroidobacteraceae bacterium]|nr:dihydroorotase [Steroidobacteraceae bacterium]
MTQLTITRPDDWHLHLRDGDSLGSVVGFTAARFGRAVVMPNLKPPVTTAAAARAYHARIVAALPAGCTFQPLMTLYLTDNTAPDEVDRAIADGLVVGVKYYPAGATTNSDSGVTSIERAFPVLERMQERSLVLQLHGEATDPAVDVFDRERAFIGSTLELILKRFPALKVVLEHVTTREGVDFVRAQGPNVAGTITPQHLLLNRNAMFQGGIRPHLYCLPVLKREHDRVALVEAATSGSPKFFLGTDSAPHARHTKENACGCAGVFSAHAGIELYAEAFEQAGALARLEGFASHFGADFYGLPRNRGAITLRREPWTPPASYAFGAHEIVPFRAGESIAWRLTTAGCA